MLISYENGFYITINVNLLIPFYKPIVVHKAEVKIINFFYKSFDLKIICIFICVILMKSLSLYRFSCTRIPYALVANSLIEISIIPDVKMR
jgi:hypothetical protein